jgi:hypothetical protein
MSPDTRSDPTACPPGWTSYQPPAGKPPPGRNPAYDQLEAERLRRARLVQEATEALTYHELRGQGLAASLRAYLELVADIEKQQADLLSAR